MGIEVRRGKRMREGREEGAGGREEGTHAEPGREQCGGQAQPEAAAAEPTASQEGRSCDGTGSKRRSGVPSPEQSPWGLKEPLLSL